MNDLQKMQALEKKLIRGIPLDQACVQLYMDIKAAQKWLQAREELDDFEKIVDGMWGRATAVEAIEDLKKIIAECPDYETRRRANKDLLEFYRCERLRLEKKVEESKKVASLRIEADIWDTASNPWDFTTEDS